MFKQRTMQNILNICIADLHSKKKKIDAPQARQWIQTLQLLKE